MTSKAYLAEDGIPFSPVEGSDYIRTGVKLWSPSPPENTEEANREGCYVFPVQWPFTRAEELINRVGLVK